jgi:uncharacterized membrane protein HdeD (DUF308 family)
MTTADNTARIHPRSDAMSGVMARNWWAVALRGLFAILFGVIALMTPTAAMLSLVLVFAAYMLVDGVLAIVTAIRRARAHERWGLVLLQGIVSLLAAVAAALLPGIAVLTFVYLIAGWAIVSGALGLAATVNLRGDHGRWWLGLASLLSVVAGVLLAIAPLLGALVLTWWIGAYAIVYGVTMLVLAYRLRPHREDVRQGLAHPA